MFSMFTDETDMIERLETDNKKALRFQGIPGSDEYKKFFQQLEPGKTKPSKNKPKIKKQRRKKSNGRKPQPKTKTKNIAKKSKKVYFIVREWHW